ncbi:MAG: AAA family ATPase, partial [Acidobacteriota bacterium]|nr:AAA family ATPase [Acidobacteriota bacterium]
MSRQTAVEEWSTDLARVDHYVEPQVALSLAFWWDDRRSPLILEGPPGGGKTSLALKVARVKGASFYRLQCHKFLGASEALYSW